MSKETKIFGPFDSPLVMNYLPHRQPFLFVDKILKVTVPVNEKGELTQVGTVVVGVKNATINEPYFTGHFPGMPITPGVILIETMAQVASFAVLPWVKTDKNMNVQTGFEIRLAGVDKTRFRKPVVPGDSVLVTVEVLKHRAPLWGFNCKMEVDGAVVAETEILASVAFPEKSGGK